MTSDSEIETVLGDLGGIESFKRLANYLRDDKVRDSIAVKEAVPDIIGASNEVFKSCLDGSDDSLALEALRALVNLAADNDYNRGEIATKERAENACFWDLISKILSNLNDDVRNRTTIFLGQFIHNTSLKPRFVELFHEQRLDYILTDYLREIFPSLDRLIVPYEVVSEIYQNCVNDITTEKEFALVAKDYVDFHITVLEYLERQELADEDEDLYDSVSAALFNCTLANEIPNLSAVDAIARLLAVLSKIPSNLTHYTVVKRRLFSAIGGVSYIEHDNRKDVDLCLHYLAHPGDPYVLSACMVVLGNFVNSKSQSIELLGLIDRCNFVENVFSIGFNDPVQYQGFHLFNNMMSDTLAHEIFLNENLPKIVHIVASNDRYYREVSKVFLRFMKKIISIEFLDSENPVDFYSLIDLWNSFDLFTDAVDKEDVNLLLLQAMMKHSSHQVTSFQLKLLDTLVSTETMQGNLPIELLFSKLKTMGIFNNNLITQKVTLWDFLQQVYKERAPEFLDSLRSFLSTVQAIIPMVQESTQKQILTNNIKFVAGTTLSLLDGTENDLHATCKDIISLQ